MDLAEEACRCYAKRFRIETFGSSEIRGVNRIRNVIGFLSNPHLVAANVLRAICGVCLKEIAQNPVVLWDFAGRWKAASFDKLGTGFRAEARHLCGGDRDPATMRRVTPMGKTRFIRQNPREPRPFNPGHPARGPTQWKLERASRGIAKFGRTGRRKS